ncbi:MAG: ferredoxin [Spirochaetia bacterium]|nr:ferredoxin [Spirochaetia bacterium]
MSKIVYVNKDDCTSCALCTDDLPQYFKMDDDDLAEAYNKDNSAHEANVPDADIDKIQEMIDDCPGECIHWKA